MHFGTKSWSKMVVSWRSADFIYGVIKTCLCSERVVYVHYVAIDDLVSTTPLKKKKKKKKKNNDITALWSCSGMAGASLLGQDVVASLLSDEADFTYVQTQKTQSHYCFPPQ